MTEIELKNTSFSPLVDSEFAVLHEDIDFTLTLIEVDTRGQAPAENPRAPFILIFSGPNDQTLMEALYTLRHDTAGEASMHLIPIQSPAGSQHYQAIFN